MIPPRPDADPPLRGRAGEAVGLRTYRLADRTVVAYLEQGPAGAATTIVLVHGWSQDHTSWDDVLAVLDTGHPGLRVLAYDARGHGRSDAGPRGSATIDQFADDLADVLHGLVPAGRVVLAGHSLGGPVIMAFAERHPRLLADRVDGVALVATSGARVGHDLFGLPERLTAPALLVAPLVTRLRALSRARVNLHHPALIAGFIRRGIYGPGHDSHHNRIRTAAQTSRAHPATTAQLVHEMLRHDRLHRLAALNQASTVVLAGTLDGLCPIAHSRALAERMPEARLVVYPRAGHMLPYERPDEVVTELAKLAAG